VSDEGFFVGYSINSKAFRVFNTRTRKVEENLHLNFLKNKPNVAGSRPEWLFDIDLLTNSMNYEPVTTGNQTNKNAGIKDNVDAIHTQQYIMLPLLYDSPEISKDAVADDAGKKTNEEPANKSEGNGYANNTNRDSTVSLSVSTAGQNFANADDLPTDPLIPDLEDTSIFSGAYDDEDVGAEVDLNNLETTMNVSPIPTTRIHKDHPKDQIIRDINSATQTRRMIKIFEEHAMVCYIKKQWRTNHKDYQNCLFACFLSQIEPKKVIQALTDPSWIEAMQEELLQFKLQKVWTLVDLPKGKRAIGTKWVYRNKKDERGIVVRNKARLVAQGYTQEEGIDYDEVFAPVARIEAMRLFLAYASFMGFSVYQMDVKSAFLYGTIEEEVYVCQPPGFEDPQFPDKVYKVEKALYGLHQAPRAWYETLSTYLLENGFRRGTIDKTLFIKKDKGDILLVQVYVDDIIFGSTKKSLCLEFEQIMHKRFQMSSMRELTFFLGLQIQQKNDGIFISQDKYVADILKKFDFVTVKTTSTPMEPNKALVKDEEADNVDVHLYRSMIGSLMYLTASRPDITFAVCACARFQVTPKVSHLHAVKRIFRYLKGQPKLGLWYPRDSPFDLEAFSDSDYARASLDRKSTTGGCQFLGKRLISWQCKKQTIVANYTTEAEYVAAANCCGYVLWIQNQMFDYGFNFMNTKIYIDNESIICIVKNPVCHSKTKNIKNKAPFQQRFLLEEVDSNETVYKEKEDKMERAATTALIDLPKGKRAIGTKWVYRNKKDEKGIVVGNKAKLVAQGYTQEEGIDYDEVFAPVARIEAIRAWYETLSTYLLENGFRRGTIDKTLFIKKDKGDILLVQVYVDDIIFGSTKKSLCVEFEQMMHKRFQMSSMGELTFFLGLQVQQKEDGIFISQDKYVADILKKFDFVTVKTASTPMEPNKALVKDEEADNVDVHLYRSMIGSLMYLTASRPDITFVVCACARFQVTPKVSHLHAV
ncbi:putative ribonuclease H-like domain-containing protein, partial [Tanacetum coccineum]